MIHPTIRTRIILWFGLMVTGILCIFSLFAYYNFRATLLADTDDLLKLKAIGVINYIDAYWNSQKRKGLERGEDPLRFAKFNSINFVKISETWVDAIPADPELADISISIFSQTGQLFASSRNFAGTQPLSKAAVAAALQGKTVLTDVVDRTAGGPKKRMHVLTVPVVEDDVMVCILQLGRPLTFVHRALGKLRVKLLLFLPASLLLAVVTGWLLADVTLRPLNSFIKTVRHISADRLSARVEAPATKDEMRLLADTFNDMLGKLEQAFAMQKQIVQDVSHELRTPLTILKGEIEVALKKVRSRDEYQSTLTSSLEEIDRINRMVENLLFLARFDSRQFVFELKEILLTPFLEVIINDVRVLADQKDIELKSELRADVFVRADRGNLKRAMINVLDNAVKYTPAQGTVVVSLTKQNDRAIIRVSDTGGGIEAARLPFVFDRFYRADTARASAGFGLGLSIAKAIVEAHRGSIEVTSVIGHGSVFTVSLPLSLR